MSAATIREMPEQDRPREKLVRHGPAALSNAELIALLLRTGVPGASAISLASSILARFGSLAALSRCSVAELAKIRGIGPGKATLLVAAFGLGSRIAAEVAEKLPMDTPERVYAYLAPDMGRLRTEAIRVLLLDTRLRLIRAVEVSHGSVNESIAHPREILREAILHSAYGIVMAHNHPSGDPSPSQADLAITRRLREAAELVQIKLVDHLIIGAPGIGHDAWFSFRESGFL